MINVEYIAEGTTEQEQLERYLLKENDLTGEEFVQLIVSDKISNEVKDCVSDALEQMKGLEQLGFKMYKDRITGFKEAKQKYEDTVSFYQKKKMGESDEF